MNHLNMWSFFLILGDQISSKDGQNLFIYASDVVQVSAAPLLRAVVYLPARICWQLPLQGASAAYSLWCAEENAGQEAAGSRWGRKLRCIRKQCRSSDMLLKWKTLYIFDAKMMLIFYPRCVTVCCCSCVASTASQSWPSGCCLRWRRLEFNPMLSRMGTITRCVLLVTNKKLLRSMQFVYLTELGV